MTTKDLRRAFLLCALFTVLNSLPAVLHGLETVELELDVRLSWNATRRESGPRCFTVQLDEPGYLLIELATTSASTAPGTFVLAAEDSDVVPDTVERIESVLLRVRRSGKQPFCLTSGRPQLADPAPGDRDPVLW